MPDRVSSLVLEILRCAQNDNEEWVRSEMNLTGVSSLNALNDYL